MPAPQQTKLLATLVASDYNTIVTQLYVSYFGRPADSGGFANFKSQMAGLQAPNDIQQLTAAYKSNAGLRSLIDSFGSSDESKALYSGDTSTFVTAIYVNVLGRAPDDAGKAFWAGAIDRGELTRANASLAIMAGALSNTTAQGVLDAKLINNRVTVALNFSNALTGSYATAYSGDTAAASARSMLATVTATTNTASFQTTVINTLNAMLPVSPLFTAVQTIIRARCVSCHSSAPLNSTYTSGPNGIEFDTPDQIRSTATQIFQVAVLTSTMPFGGPALSSSDRQAITAWVNAGAP